MRIARWSVLLVLAAPFFFTSVFGQSARESTLVIGADLSDLITMDPGVSYEFSGSLIVNNLYETLVKFEGDDLSEVKPGLAESWEVGEQEGGSTLTFTLRDATFASGNPVTARDVVYSFDRVIELESPSSFLLSDVAGLEVGSTVAVDDKTVELTLPEGVNPTIVLNLLTFNVGGVVDSQVAQENEQDGDFGSAWLTENSAGSGPYTLVRWDRGAQVALEANENASQSGSISRVILRNIQESSAQRSALESNEIDVAYDLTPEAFKAADGDERFAALPTDTFVLSYLGMNSGEGQPFADNRVRQAVRYALDQDGIVDELLGGLGRKMQTIIPAGLFGANEKVFYEQNPERAKELLTEAGVGDGLSVEFLVPTGSCFGGVPCADLAAKVQSDLAAVGIQAEIRQTVEAELLDIYRAQEAELVLINWSPDYPDPDGNATPMADFGAQSLAWRNVWENADASQLAQQAASETDLDARAALYDELTTLVAEEGPYAILFQPSKPVVTLATVTDFVRTAQGNVDFTAVSKTE